MAEGTGRSAMRGGNKAHLYYWLWAPGVSAQSYCFDSAGSWTLGNMRHLKLGWVILGVLLLGSGACGDTKTSEANNNGKGGRPGGGNGPVSVRISEAIAGALNREIPCTGEIRADIYGVVSPLDSGRLETLDLVEGQSVVAGQVVAMLDPVVQDRALAEVARRVATAEARYAQAKAELDAKKSQIRRVQTLADQNAYPAAQLAELVDASKVAEQAVSFARAQVDEAKEAKRSAETLLERRQVSAPFGGIVSKRLVAVGALVAPQIPLAEVYDPGSLYFSTSIPEKNLVDVTVGTQVIVWLDALGGQGAPGDRGVSFRVRKIGDIVDSASRTVEIRASPDDALSQVKPGMFGRCAIVVESVADGVLVPVGSLDSTKDGSRVWVVSGGKVNPVPVEVRLRTERLAAVVGITAGAQVVSSETGKLAAGAAVEVVP